MTINFGNDRCYYIKLNQHILVVIYDINTKGNIDIDGMHSPSNKGHNVLLFNIRTLLLYKGHSYFI